MEKDFNNFPYFISPEKWAVITGASSGIGQEMARELSKRGYGVLLIARRLDRLERLSESLHGESMVFCADLSKLDGPKKIINFIKEKNINVEVFINNAGFGDLGYFTETSLSKELEMQNVNIRSMHILMKHFLKVFEKNERGYILNVASSAGLMPGGPKMSTYYATKSYVVSLTNGVATELKQQKSNVYVGALCPGPVSTEFNDVAGVKFSLSGISPKMCAKYAIRKMFERKVIIVPSLAMKTTVKIAKLAPTKLVLKACLKIQSSK